MYCSYGSHSHVELIAGKPFSPPILCQSINHSPGVSFDEEKQTADRLSNQSYK